MVYVIKDTVDIYCFCKNWYKTAQEHLLFQAASSFLETNREIPTVFFQNSKKFLEFNTPTPRAKKVGRKPDPPGSENERIPVGRQGDGQVWN